MVDFVQWANMWGAKLKLRNDMPDDMLKDAIETSRRVLDNTMDFEIEGVNETKFCSFISI